MTARFKKNLFSYKISSQLILLLATLSALMAANSQFHDSYRDFFQIIISPKIPFVEQISFTFKQFIDDFLMVIFFFLIGLELKKEVIVGELSSKSKIFLPTFAALGGVILPALIFSYFNIANEENLKGFAIPCATDIAFAYAVVKIFGDKVTPSIKIFIITLAVIDDLIAILIIAIFYTAEINEVYLLLSSIAVLGLVLLNLKNSKSRFLYLILGISLYLMILKSGIHPTVAGVIIAFSIPFKTRTSFPVENIAHKISPIVNYFILPVFAFANAGVAIKNFSWTSFADTLILGIILGLFFGKQIGVMLFSYIIIKLKICNLPPNSNWLELYGIAILTGIGFTMSLFIGNLAFSDELILDKVKIAVLVGSLASFIFGSLILICERKNNN